MPTIDDTVQDVLDAGSWDERDARIRLVPGKHGTDDHQAIYAQIARLAYVPHLAPDFAYIHGLPFYDLDTFESAYEAAASGTDGFTAIALTDLTRVLIDSPRSLLAFRTITGLGRNEFAAATALVAPTLDLKPLSASKVDSMERSGTATSEDQATVAATTLVSIMDGTLFGNPPGDLRSKQDKPDTARGWSTVERLAATEVPYSWLLHQRHYGGAFRQLLDATSERRGDIIEDAVEELFQAHRVLFIRTGSHNQAEIEERFDRRPTGAGLRGLRRVRQLRAMLECKGASDGGTARDKALRFERLREESVRLGGVPLLAVLGGLGWTRVNDTLGPVVRCCDGRVFAIANLPEMMTVAPFPIWPL